MRNRPLFDQLFSLATSAPTSATTALNERGSCTRQGWIAAGLAFVVPLLFAFYTNHVWEDYYITFRASKNLAEGHGLVYQVGEHVHSFTSPLGVLLPALLSFLTHSDTATLWCFRVLCCAALAGAAFLLWQLLELKGASRLTCWFVTLALLAESKVIDFTINGMETAFMMLFGAALLKTMLDPKPSAWRLGAILGGLMWTRPDAFVLGGAIIVACLVFTLLSRAALGAMIRLLLIAGLWATILYGPWLLWAKWYYGSPVPNTIIAKSGGIQPNLGWSFLWQAPLKYLTSTSPLEWLMNPSYFFLGGWSEWMIRTSAILTVLAGFLWLLPRLPVVGRVASFALFLGSYYLQAIPPAPWYFPFWYMLAAISLGVAGAWCLEQLPATALPRKLVRVGLLVIFVQQAATVPLVALQTRYQQRIVENRGRRAIGEWLAVHASPNDTVFLEPLGYIGYFSQCHMLDFPGLSAPRVIAARRKRGEAYRAVIPELQPTWMVLRGWFVSNLIKQGANFLDAYEVVRIWDVSDQLKAIDLLPGRGLLEYDSSYVVFHRKTTQ